jgi:hypothetical protein
MEYWLAAIKRAHDRTMSKLRVSGTGGIIIAFCVFIFTIISFGILERYSSAIDYIIGIVAGILAIILLYPLVFLYFIFADAPNEVSKLRKKISAFESTNSSAVVIRELMKEFSNIKSEITHGNIDEIRHKISEKDAEIPLRLKGLVSEAVISIAIAPPPRSALARAGITLEMNDLENYIEGRINLLIEAMKKL